MKRKSSKASLFALMLILGVLVAVQFRILRTGFKYVKIQDIDYLYTQIESEKAEIEQIKKTKLEIENKVNEYENSENYFELEKTLKKNLDEIIKFAGLSRVRGEGIIVIISDGDRELLNNENPNNVLVHDLDIKKIITDLRNAGAEAISINGQRILFGKSIVHCTGPTIKVNNSVFAQPFIIKAIGNRTYLESAINAPGRYGNILRDWGLFVEVNTSVSIVIPKYSELIYSNYTHDDKGSEEK
ncbi:DUF881 domain-containing protein [Helicovermis profundi]|uniref:DUF881 domain-containing protein n=1 Tax=Helicovermis profundi TaxID=3065157 RepID=A0AAU9EWL7_9FIRM|nr:DUF881 domain-containing protein [Clostridia bacterium S502]